jgi:gliding motility-associatede transport system auxiliary component
MALNTESPAARGSASGWMLAPAYAASLVLIFAGERVVTSDTMRTALSGVGVIGAVVATALRFVEASTGASGERRVVERTLALLSTLGLVAIGLYFTSTDAAKAALGIAKATPEVRARIESGTTVAWIALLVIALLPLLFGELAFAPMRRAAHVEARRVRAAIASALSIAFALVYVGLFTYTAGELDQKVDFSYFRTSRPSDSTKKIAESSSEAIKVMAFFPQLNEVGTEVEGYLRELHAAAPSLKIETYDRLLVPAIAREAKVSQDGVIVLTRGNAKETLSVGAEMKTSASKLKTLDGDFQKALLKVLRDAHVAYFTVGHGEINEAGGADAAEGRTGKSLRRLFESQNYTVKDLGLAQGLGTEIPDDATVVAVLGPSKALLPEEIATLKRYADKGGHLLLALDPEPKADMAPLADAVGLVWHPTLLATDKTYVRRRYNNSDRTILVTNRFSSHASVSTVSRNSARGAVIFPGASSLDKKDGNDAKVDFAVKSFPEAFEDLDGNLELTATTEKRASYNLGAAVSHAVTPRPDWKGKDAPEMRAFVLADVDGLSDAAFTNEPNVFFAVDLVRWLGGEESFTGSITTTEDVRIEHTKQKDQAWFYATIFGAPSLLLGVGLVVTRRKRQKAPAKAATKEKKA